MGQTIGIFAGSLRKESFSKKVANAVVNMAPEGYYFKMISIDDLPIYNQDFDDNGNAPEAYVKFRKEVKDLDGVIFVTPEYNRSIPSALKNALDVGSRPYGQSVWDGKPGAIFSNSPGNLSAFGANHHLRQCLVFLNVPTMQQPEVYLANINEALDNEGNLKDGPMKDFIQKAVDAYIAWFDKLQ
ncbi:MAG TPA: NAD(P)H-dependent oxidoreductase [Sphingobacterium sp.]|nr:NAD(P)H-dependent oxidoreductase [Sphingobacterium sp.]